MAISRRKLLRDTTGLAVVSGLALAHVRPLGDTAAMVANNRELENRLYKVEADLSAVLRNPSFAVALNSSTEPPIADGAIGTPKLANGAVETAKIADNAVSTPKIPNDAITTVKILDGAITSAKVNTLEANKIVAGTGIVNNLTINATLTLGAGGKIVDADGSEWNQNLLRLVSAGAESDAFVLNAGSNDVAFIAAESAPGAMFGLTSAQATIPTSLVLKDGKLILGFESLGFNTLRPRVMVEAGGVAICGNVTPTYGSGTGVIFIGTALVNPSTNPTGGGILYVDAGALKYRGSSGTTTTIANA